MSIADIAWLAGIIDGEGCVTALRDSQRGVSCRVTIESVSVALYRKVIAILVDSAIAYSTEGPLTRLRSTRPSYRIRVYRKQACLALCNLILPYSVVKRPELLLIQQYLTKAGAVAYYHATEEDLQLLCRLKEMKRLA